MNKSNQTPTAFLWVARDDTDEAHYTLHPDEPQLIGGIEDCLEIHYSEEPDYDGKPEICREWSDNKRANQECCNCDLRDSIWISQKMDPHDFAFVEKEWIEFKTGIELGRGEGPVKLRLVKSPEDVKEIRK